MVSPTNSAGDSSSAGRNGKHSVQEVDSVTIRFADAIGDVLVAAPVDGSKRLPFKFYI